MLSRFRIEKENARVLLQVVDGRVSDFHYCGCVYSYDDVLTTLSVVETNDTFIIHPSLRIYEGIYLSTCKQNWTKEEIY